MNKILLFVDSCSSVTKEEAQKLGVKIIPTLFNMDGKDYNPLAEDIISYEEYYERLENKEFSKTSCINPSVIIDYFKPYLEEGFDIIYITLSSGLSSSYNNALLAKDILSDDYDNNIEIIDSRTGSVGIQISMFKALEMIKEGKSANEIKNALDGNKLNVNSLFIVGSLDHLRRGGRLSTISAIIGSLLHICPIISANLDGKLEAHSKHRGRKKALKAIIDIVKKHILPNEKVYIAYTNNPTEKEFLEEEFKSNGLNTHTGIIDYTMGAHCGPRTLAVFFVSDLQFK